MDLVAGTADIIVKHQYHTQSKNEILGKIVFSKVPVSKENDIYAVYTINTNRDEEINMNIILRCDNPQIEREYENLVDILSEYFKVPRSIPYKKYNFIESVYIQKHKGNVSLI